MEILILKNNKAEDSNGKQYEIEGVEITRQNTKAKVFYGTDTSFFKAACCDGIKSHSYLLPNGKLMLV